MSTPLRKSQGARVRVTKSARALAMLLLVVGVAAACSTNADEGKDAAGKSCDTRSEKANPDADYDFFDGKTINYVVANSPGTVTALQIVAMEPAIEEYLCADVNISYVPSATSIGQNQVAEAEPDGLTLGAANVLSDLSKVYSGEDTFGFELDKLSYVGSTLKPPGLIVACKGSPFKTADDLISSGTEASIVTIPNGSFDALNHMVMAAWPIPHKYLLGYDTASAQSGCQRGDGAISGLQVANWMTASGDALVPGITPLILTGKVAEGSPAAFVNDMVPTLDELKESTPPPTERGMQALELAIAGFDNSSPGTMTFGPEGVPEDRLLALSEAMEYAIDQPSVQEGLLAGGFPVGFIGGQEVDEFIQTQLTPENREFIESLLAE